MSEQTAWGDKWIAAGLREDRRRLVKRRNDLLRRPIPADVRARGAEAIDAIIGEIDVQIRGLSFEEPPLEVKP